MTCEKTSEPLINQVSGQSLSAGKLVGMKLISSISAGRTLAQDLEFLKE
jgi:hypothetical protein